MRSAEWSQCGAEVISFRRATCKLAGFGSELFCGAEYRIYGTRFGASFGQAYNLSMNLLKSLAAVSSITMLSRVLGFVRDTIIARAFGAGMATDAFFIAFKLPNLLRRIFAEGAFSQAFVPILAEYKSQQGEEATRTFVAYVTGLLTLALAVVTVLGIVFAP